MNDAEFVDAILAMSWSDLGKIAAVVLLFLTSCLVAWRGVPK